MCPIVSIELFLRVLGGGWVQALPLDPGQRGDPVRQRFRLGGVGPGRLGSPLLLQLGRQRGSFFSHHSVAECSRSWIWIRL
jgi:hypothetical protein